MQSQLNAEFSLSSPALFGDFYNEPDDVMRGLTLPAYHDLGFANEFQKGERDQENVDSQIQEFQVTDVPPVLSDNVKAFLGCTTLELSEDSPVTVGNNIVAFFQNEVDAKLEKVSRKKFTIRAEVISLSLHCDIKVRIYGMGQGSLVEFQQRSGDILAFQHLYRKASGYLQGFRTLEVASSSVPNHVKQELAQAEATPFAESLAPLLDMVNAGQDRQLLAEVALALASLSQDANVAMELRKPCAFSVLQQLGQAEDFSTAFPASRALCVV